MHFVTFCNITTLLYIGLLKGNVYFVGIPDVPADTTCFVCKVADRVFTVVPCGHYGVCESCKTQLEVFGRKKCPYCRHANVSFVLLRNV